MAGQNSTVIFNARELLISADLNRVQRLASRETQDRLRDQSRGPNLLGSPGANTFFGTDTEGPVVGGASRLPTLVPAAGFDLTLGAGQAYLEDNTIVGDDSTYQLLRWPQQDLTFAVPDATNPRIDLVYALPGSANADFQSRTVLLDPVTRTTGASSVPKTNNPVASVVVLAGVPAATPAVPALPAGALALFEVLVPASAPDSTTFAPVRRLWERIEGPFASCHGILENCLIDGGPAVESADAGVSLGSGNHRLIVDGEVLSWGIPGLLVVVADTLNDPFGAAAPANNDRPYYFYLVGGRNLPQHSHIGVGATSGSPVVLVESLTAPDINGRPSSPINTPRGQTQAGAVYVGVGATVMNTVFRKSVLVKDGWSHARTGQNPFSLTGTGLGAGFNEPVARTLGAGVTSHTLASAPSQNAVTHARLKARLTGSTANTDISVGFQTGGVFMAHAMLAQGPQVTVSHQVEWEHTPSRNTFHVDVDPGGAVLSVWPMAWRLNVKRYGL